MLVEHHRMSRSTVVRTFPEKTRIDYRWVCVDESCGASGNGTTITTTWVVEQHRRCPQCGEAAHVFSVRVMREEP